MNLHVLAEKPVVFKKENLIKLMNSLKKENSFQICYQKRFFRQLFFEKKILEQEKKYGSIKTVIFELFNGDMRNGTKSFCRTKEQINYGIRPYADSIKLANKSNLTNFKIFINRYIHSINLFLIFSKQII